MGAGTANRGDFRVGACVDWLDISIQTSRVTQAIHVKSAIDKIAGGNHHVDPKDKRQGTGENATIFTIRFHDELANDSLALIAVINELAAKFPLRIKPTITAIEVACDFKYKGDRANLESETLAMTHRLQSSLFAPFATKPRQFDPSIERNRYLGGDNDEGSRIDPNQNFRIGSRLDRFKRPLDDVSWQVYFKVTDHNQQSINDQSKWCARAEVTIQGQALQGLGLVNMDDLRGYGFEQLLPFFKFRKLIDPVIMADGDLFKLTAITANRRINDATSERGMHSFNPIGRKDKRRRLRAQSSHIEADEQLQDSVKGALKRLAL